jgi:hypothetical protein
MVNLQGFELRKAVEMVNLQGFESKILKKLVSLVNFEHESCLNFAPNFRNPIEYSIQIKTIFFDGEFGRRGEFALSDYLTGEASKVHCPQHLTELSPLNSTPPELSISQAHFQHFQPHSSNQFSIQLISNFLNPSNFQAKFHKNFCVFPPTIFALPLFMLQNQIYNLS